MAKIAYIGPVGPETESNVNNDFILNVVEDYRRFLGDGDKLDFFTLNKGPKHLEYRYYEAMITTDLLYLIRKLDKDYDACIIGCFYDPGLYAAREIAKNAVITAPAESSFGLATQLGEKFSVLVGRDKHIPRMIENIKCYGYTERLASFRSINMGVKTFHDNELLTIKRLREQGKAAIEEDGAEVLILGCTLQAGFYKALQDDLGVPVIDPVLAALCNARSLIGYRDGFNWRISKSRSFEAPPECEITQWNLDKIYS